MGPISRVVHAFEVDEQPRRGILQLADRSDRPLEGLGTVGQRSAASPGRQWLRAGLRVPGRRHGAGLLGSAVQHHLGRHDGAGHRRTADRQRSSSSSAMPARARRSSPSSARVSRMFRFRDRWQVEVLAEGFNLTDRANVVTRNANFGAGAYPDSPSSTFNQITAVGEPRSFQSAPGYGFRSTDENDPPITHNANSHDNRSGSCDHSRCCSANRYDARDHESREQSRRGSPPPDRSSRWPGVRRRTARATSSSLSAGTAATRSQRRCASTRSRAMRASAARSRRAWP